jgi:WD40 repeat protein
MDKDELLVPAAVWTDVPQHEITCIGSPCKDIVVTGCTTGELCLWQNGVARALVISRYGPPCPITAIESTMFKGVPVVVVGSADGSITVYNALTGDSMAGAPHLLPDRFVASRIHIAPYFGVLSGITVFCLCYQDNLNYAGPEVSSQDHKNFHHLEEAHAFVSRVYMVQFEIMDAPSSQSSASQFFDLYGPASPKNLNAGLPAEEPKRGFMLPKTSSRVIIASILVPTSNSISHLLITLSTDLILRAWFLRAVNSNDLLVSARFEHSLATLHLNPTDLDASPDAELLLVTSAHHLFLFKITAHFATRAVDSIPTFNLARCGSSSFIDSSGQENDSVFIEGGKFVGNRRIIVWTTCGKMQIFRLDWVDDSQTFNFNPVATLAGEARESRALSSLHRVVEVSWDSPAEDKGFCVFVSGNDFGSGVICGWNFSPDDLKNEVGLVKEGATYSIASNFVESKSVDVIVENDHGASVGVTASCLFDTGTQGIFAVLGYGDGSIRCRALLDRSRVVSLEKHESKVTTMLGVRTKYVVKNSPDITRPPVLVTGSDDGEIKFFRMDTFECISTYDCHSRCISSFVYNSFEGTHHRKQYEYVTAISSDQSFSVYELEIKSVKVLQADFSPREAAVEMQSDSEIDWLNGSSDNISDPTARVDFTCVLTVFCPGHDSDVVAVLRNSWCIQSDYIISVTAAGLVYIWTASTGTLERVLTAREGKKFLIDRGLFEVGQVQDSRLLHAFSTWGIYNLPQESTELVSNLSVSNQELFPTMNRANQDSVFGTLKGLSKNLNLQVFFMDVRVLSNLHCSVNPDLASAVSSFQLNEIEQKEESKDFKESGMKANNEDDLARGRLTGAFRHFASATMLQANRRRSASAEPRKSSNASGDDEKRPSRTSRSVREAQRALQRELRISLSFLIDWSLGIDDGIDSDLKKMLALFNPYDLLGFFSPNAHITSGLFGCVPKFSKNQYSLTLLLPRSGDAQETPASFRWKFSSRFTAIHSIALNTLCMSLMTSGSALQQSFFCRLVSFYSVVMASSLPHFVDSSLMVLGFYGLHKNENIHTASRMLLQSVIERLNFDERHRLFRLWSRFYLEIPKSNPNLTSNPEFMSLVSELLAHESKENERINLSPESQNSSSSEFAIFSLAEVSRFEQQLVAILILSFIILECPEEFDSRFAKLLSTHLITLICDSDGGDVIATSLAADLLGKGIEFWKNHTSDMGSLLQSLVRLSGSKDDSGKAILTVAVERALTTAAQAAPKMFVATIGNEALRPSISPEERASCILKLGAVIKNYPESQLVVLPRIVETLTKCLDPAEPGLRKALIKPCTSALHALTKSYPMVSCNVEFLWIEIPFFRFHFINNHSCLQ